MQPTQRTYRSRLIRSILTEPERYQFFQAVRLLSMHWSRAGERRSRQLVGDFIRFRNSLELSFPPSEIEAIEVTDAPPEDGFDAPAAQEPVVRTIELTTPFMGLTGVAGVLPRHYTETLARREVVYRDRAARRFLDLFSSRMVGFFFEAWRKYRLPLQHEEEPGRRFLPQLLLLAGHRPEPASRRKDSGEAGSVLPPEFFAYYAGLLRQQQVSPTNLCRVLKDFFEVPVRVEPFVGRWFSIPEEQLTRLSSACAHLGQTTFCGERVWQRDHRLRLVFGPLDGRQNAEFLPGGRSMRALKEILKRCYGLTLEFEILLILKNVDAKPAQLGTGAQGTHLGRNSFLATKAFTHDVQHVRYEISFGPGAA